MNDGGDNQKTTKDHFFVAWFLIFAVEDVLLASTGRTCQNRTNQWDGSIKA